MVESRLWCRNAQRYVDVVYRERVAESEFNLKCDSTTTQPQYNSRCGQRAISMARFNYCFISFNFVSCQHDYHHARSSIAWDFCETRRHLIIRFRTDSCVFISSQWFRANCYFWAFFVCFSWWAVQMHPDQARYLPTKQRIELWMAKMRPAANFHTKCHCD